jgi:hypothetical protein
VKEETEKREEERKGRKERRKAGCRIREMSVDQHMQRGRERRFKGLVFD